MAGGRPTKYTPELLEAAQRYLDGGYAEECDNPLENEVIPSIAGLGLRIGVSRKTCHEWANDDIKTEFRDIYERILQKQEQLLIANGLSGKFNSAITKLVLGKHGYSDKTDNTHAGADGGPIEFSRIERVLVSPANTNG